jgi:hypothetical protein
MKRLSLLLMFVLFQVLVFAQLKPIAEGPLFQEDVTGYSRILQLKNGNTVYLHLSLRTGIDVTIYNSDHHLKKISHIDPAFGALKGACINSLFEVDGNIILMISEVEERTPTLYRVVINGISGDMEREDKLGATAKYQSKDLPFIPEYPSVSSFVVRKDPLSDNYALLIKKNNDDAAVRNQVELILYDKDHRETARAYYDTPYRYHSLNFLDMAVIEGDKVCMLGFAYNQIAANDREGQLVMTMLEKGAKRMKTEILNLSGDRIVDSAIVRYNPVLKKLLLLGSAHVEDAETPGYNGFLVTLDPYTSRLEKEFSIYPEKANAMKKEIFGEKEPFKGMPQALNLHNDGSFSILFEELTKVSVNHIDAASYNYYLLDNIAISNFDTAGQTTHTWFIPKKQVLKNSEISSFYLANRATDAQKLQMGDQYRSFAFLEGKDKSYVFLNDSHKNTSKLKTKKISAARTVGECDAFYYHIDESNFSPDRSMLFEKRKINPHTDRAVNTNKEHILGMFNISDYDRENNVYITLQLIKLQDMKGARLVWLSL